MLKPFRYAWQRLRRLVSLVHGFDDVRQTYGDNPNGVSDDARLTTAAGRSNITGGSA
jgi:hypothetical protein